jgi:tetratricopeptide (TPR) repeat protein
MVREMNTVSAADAEAMLAAIRAGELVTAKALAEKILVQRPSEPNALQALGFVLWREGRLAAAKGAFERANAAAPNNPAILNSLGVLRRESGDLPSSRAALEAAVRCQPDFVDAWHNLGSTLAALGEDARLAFDKAIALSPRHAAALGKYAHYLETRHEVGPARAMAERALAIDSENFLALSALTSLELRARSFETAVQLADRLLANPKTTPTNRAVIHGKRARALEKLSRYAESFADSAAANAIMSKLRGAAMDTAVGPRSPATLTRLEAFACKAPLSLWSGAPAPSRASPVFMVGFPRSGTTMLDQILSTFDRVCVMEEKENIADAWLEFLVAPDGLDRWSRMGAADIERLRVAYWRRAERHINKNSQLVIDKLPLDTALLGLIHFLFPDAKIIFALRDPRDVVLSCFQQTFGINASMVQFLDLETAAAYYDQVMRLGALWRDRLPLNVHEIRYEKVVTEFDAEIGALLHFLGLPWSDDLRRFHETARKRTIRTPSATQVIEPLYASAVGKWRHYEKELAPVRALLDPWAQRFGYAL